MNVNKHLLSWWAKPINEKHIKSWLNIDRYAVVFLLSQVLCWNVLVLIKNICKSDDRIILLQNAVGNYFLKFYQLYNKMITHRWYLEFDTVNLFLLQFACFLVCVDLSICLYSSKVLWWLLGWCSQNNRAFVCLYSFAQFLSFHFNWKVWRSEMHLILESLHGVR